MDLLAGILYKPDWQEHTISDAVKELVTASLQIGGIHLAELEQARSEARWQRLQRRWLKRNKYPAPPAKPGQCGDFCCCPQCFDII